MWCGRWGWRCPWCRRERSGDACVGTVSSAASMRLRVAVARGVGRRLPGRFLMSDRRQDTRVSRRRDGCRTRPHRDLGARVTAEKMQSRDDADRSSHEGGHGQRARRRRHVRPCAPCRGLVHGRRVSFVLQHEGRVPHRQREWRGESHLAPSVAPAQQAPPSQSGGGHLHCSHACVCLPSRLAGRLSVTSVAYGDTWLFAAARSSRQLIGISVATDSSFATSIGV